MKYYALIIIHKPLNCFTCHPYYLVFSYLGGERKCTSHSVSMSLFKITIPPHWFLKVTFESNAHEETYPFHLVKMLNIRVIFKTFINYLLTFNQIYQIFNSFFDSFVFTVLLNCFIFMDFEFIPFVLKFYSVVNLS